MKKILIWTVVVITFLVVFVFYTTRETEEDRIAKQRYKNANSGQQKCVHVLNNGAYAHKSLTWKLDKCDVPK